MGSTVSWKEISHNADNLLYHLARQTGIKTVMGQGWVEPDLDQDCFFVHTPCPLFKPKSYQDPEDLHGRVTDPLCTCLLNWPTEDKCLNLEQALTTTTCNVIAGV